MTIFRLSICEDITCITVRKRSLGQGNICTVACQSFCPWGGSLHDVTSCLSVCPCSFQGFSVSGPMLLPRGLCLGSLCPGVSVQGNLCQGDPQTDTPYGEEQVVHFLLKCILVLEGKTITLDYLLHFGVRIVGYLSSLKIVISYSSLLVNILIRTIAHHSRTYKCKHLPHSCTPLAFCRTCQMMYRSGTVNSKSFVVKVLLRIKWKFELN